MMNRPDGPRTVAFALCGSFCSFSAVLPQVRRLRALGWRVLPILSCSAAALDTRFGTSNIQNETCGNQTHIFLSC